MKEITNFDPQARVLMCSAMGQQASGSEAIQAGAKDLPSSRSSRAACSKRFSGCSGK